MIYLIKGSRDCYIELTRKLILMMKGIWFEVWNLSAVEVDCCVGVVDINV